MHFLVTGLQVALHERAHEHITPQIDFFLDIQALSRLIDSQLRRLARLARHIPADTPLASNVNARGSEDVRLQAVLQVVKACFVGDFALVEAARQIADQVGDGVPRPQLSFIFGRIGGRISGFLTDDERVQLDHGDMVVEARDGGVARDARRYRRDVGEERATHGPSGPCPCPGVYTAGTTV